MQYAAELVGEPCMDAYTDCGDRDDNLSISARHDCKSSLGRSFREGICNGSKFAAGLMREHDTTLLRVGFWGDSTCMRGGGAAVAARLMRRVIRDRHTNIDCIVYYIVRVFYAGRPRCRRRKIELGGCIETYRTLNIP
jgi:hypothetical protein